MCIRDSSSQRPCRAEARLRRSVIFELEYLVADLPDPTRRLELFSATEALEIARRGFWVKKLGD